MNCYVCDGPQVLIWGGDHDLDEDDAYDMVTNLSCPNCQAYVEVYRSNQEHEDIKQRKLEIPSPTPDASWLNEKKLES